MASELSRHTASQAWCTEKTKHMPMNPELAFAFADIIEEIWNKPWLGNATTRELIDEIRARIEIDGNLDYKPTDGDDRTRRFEVGEFYEHTSGKKIAIVEQRGKILIVEPRDRPETIHVDCDRKQSPRRTHDRERVRRKDVHVHLYL